MNLEELLLEICKSMGVLHLILKPGHNSGTHFLPPPFFYSDIVRVNVCMDGCLSFHVAGDPSGLISAVGLFDS